MAELQVIYDPQLELAAILNVDERIGWGPAMVGPDAPIILQAFIDQTPFDVSALDSYTAAVAFNQFLDKLVERNAATAATVDPVPVGPDDDSGVADQTVPTAAQGAPTDEPPAVQPADTDSSVEADESPASASIEAGRTPFVPPDTPAPPTTVQPCMLCDGTGMVQTDPDAPAATCGMCNGSGKVTVAAQPAP
jgi:hypothetical protein